MKERQPRIGEHGGSIQEEDQKTTIEKSSVYERLNDDLAEKIIEERLGSKELRKIINGFFEMEKNGVVAGPGEECYDAVADLARLLVELEGELANYDTIVSDESSARLPSLFFRQIINKKRKEADLPGVKTFFVSSGRHNFELITGKLKDFFEKKREALGKVLVVTEFVSSGESIDKLVKVLENAEVDFDLAAISLQHGLREYGRKNFPKHLVYGGVNTGGLYFWNHRGTGVIKDEYAGGETKQIHPIKKTGIGYDQKKINLSRKNIGYLADELYPLVEK